MNLLEGSKLLYSSGFPFSIHRYTIRHNENILPHTHDFVEFVYVVSGGAMHEWADNRYPLARGDVFAIEPNAYHSYTGSADQDSVIYNILFDKQLLRNEMEALLRVPAFIDFFYLAPFMRNNTSFIPYTSLKDHQRILIENHLQTIHQEYNERREGFELIIKTRWIECLVLLSRFHEDNRNDNLQNFSKDEWILSIRNFVEQNCDQELSLSQLASTCGFSISTFTSKFKQATGQTLVDYKHAAQIRRACRMLEEGDLKIAFLAHEAGFNDISFFNRIFRKLTGMTPKEYRNQVKARQSK